MAKQSQPKSRSSSLLIYRSQPAESRHSDRQLGFALALWHGDARAVYTSPTAPCLDKSCVTHRAQPKLAGAAVFQAIKFQGLNTAVSDSMVACLPCRGGGNHPQSMTYGPAVCHASSSYRTQVKAHETASRWGRTLTGPVWGGSCICTGRPRQTEGVWEAGWWSIGATLGS